MMPLPQDLEPLDDFAAFTHLTVPNAALYRAVMSVFVAAKERFTVHLRPEDVQAALPAERRPDEVMAEALQLLDGSLKSDVMLLTAEEIDAVGGIDE
jgi:hypothetical protein